MTNTFFNLKFFNPNIANWDLSKTTNFLGMFIVLREPCVHVYDEREIIDDQDVASDDGRKICLKTLGKISHKSP